MRHYIFRIFFYLIFFQLSYNTASDKPVDEKYKKIFDAIELIEKNYVGEIKNDIIINAAVQGMLSSLDSYSKLLNGREELLVDIDPILKGFYGYVGIKFFENEKRQVVIENVEIDSPAFKVGIKKDDIVQKIDGKTVAVDNFFKKISGAPGSKVELNIFRPSTKKNMNFNLVRAKKEVEVVKSHMHDDICYINASIFNVHAAKEIRNSIHKYLSHGCRIDGIILDLRGNCGGSQDAAREVASYFIDSGVLVKIKTSKDEEIVYIDKDVTKAPNVPLVVLIDQYSASAAEMVACSIKDNMRGIIIGVASYGKGVGQSYITLDDDTVVKLSTFQFFSPNGSIINKKGVQPNIIIEKVQRKNFSGNSSNSAGENMYILDNQYAKAFDVLSGHIKLLQTNQQK